MQGFEVRACCDVDKNGIAIFISTELYLVHLWFRKCEKEISLLTDGKCFEKAGRLLFEVETRFNNMIG